MSKAPLDLTAPPVPAESWPGRWRSFRNEIDALFHRFDGGFGLPAMRRLAEIEPFWHRAGSGPLLPAIDVVEDDESYAISVELPGLDEKNVTVSVSGDNLVVKGEKSEETAHKDKNRMLCERSYGAFERSFRIPETVDRDGIAAECAKGLLKVTLPKTPAAQAPEKKIDVKAA